jgi:retron-type reverse transcriptase
MAFQGPCSPVLWISEPRNFSLTEFIQHDHKIHNMDHKIAHEEIWDKYSKVSKH